MKTVNINIPAQKNNSYIITIGENACEKIPEIFGNLPSKKGLVVTNKTIFSIYENLMNKIFTSSNLEISFCILDDGEKYKNKNSLEKILVSAFENKLERNDVFIAFGGGVVGDITGFAAASYLRGVNFIQIPTTILAQVDSSVGGKVAINTSYGKNLIGAFYQPCAVISDFSLLKTLPEREILTGLSEVVKYAFIEKTCGGDFFDFGKFLKENSKQILNLEKNSIEKMIEISCKLKAAVVTQDEKEKGLRAILNLGHTIGHAIEKCTNYNTFTHGEAVAIGMKAIFKIALSLNKITREYYEFGINLINDYKLNYCIPQGISNESILEALYYDKKVKNGKIRFVIPTGYGKVEIMDNIHAEIIKSAIDELY